VVVDPRDDGSLGAELDQRAALGSGVIVCRPVPGIYRSRQLAEDLLLALGKRHDAMERERRFVNTDEDWHLLRVWLRAERTRHLLVLDADRLHADLWTILGELAGTTYLQLWMVVRGAPQPLQLHHLDRWRPWIPAQLLDRLPLPPGDARGDADPYLVSAVRARAVVVPATACAVALAAIADFDAETLVNLNLDDVSRGARAIAIGGGRFRIPTVLAAPIRAQLLCRSGRGAAKGGALLVDELGWRARPHQLIEWIELATSSGPIPSPPEAFFPHVIGGHRLVIRGSQQVRVRAHIGRPMDANEPSPGTWEEGRQIEWSRPPGPSGGATSRRPPGRQRRRIDRVRQQQAIALRESRH
jgi:hypothetical protein